MRTAALIVAAGRGLRAGGGVPKQWRDLGGQPVAAHALRAFAGHPGIDLVVVVADADAAHAALGAILGADPGAVEIVAGGPTRRDSVLAGLRALEGRAERVLIHDAARPLVSRAVIDGVLAALEDGPAAAPGLPVVDALWKAADGAVAGSHPRDGLVRAQTPQGFHLAAILAAHLAWEGEAADDVEIARVAGLRVAVTPGDAANFKITTAADLSRAAENLSRNNGMSGDMDVRLGNGYDVHRFGPGDHVWLCGVKVPHGRGLQGHSDADVGMHAATDALYGALAAGDIGRHFPPSDPRWKGAESHVFLRHACDLARSAGWRIGNVDVTLVCEHPKIGPHADDMRATMAGIMGLDPDRVSVKATTSERLGFTGREEGIAALATATLVRP
ncbi:bifunctional 2-C-methyl-D-erythritol 4-phosphate cytidylyltransferase/2-C-methyl-D-erythritol 2,4-cyclodiphosphate synthase [Wenxinia saemankumensis]|uniref:Bifunctional enzyme IspD/IspF n=1 Tax=Wenxinia saemankumensis TaxID=1447782 RepID=A0A1M6A818_9RHOB|nr:bifunctional 2-C-methyl-D-erythritol 4-phosphate cytidylyltransferase/2-C-methyl-D-erythritol 2,4-cyclodiphosphate synthase [Wenxinia saemankumensis]SHI32303.1 2-C-methyl-D-erythritol 2,4-cyclodiphosphate synthase [Wenxinia saemankumensis]